MGRAVAGKQQRCYDPPQFFSSISVAPATAPLAVHAPAPAPAVQPIPAQPVAPPQPYIRMQPPSPMQVDPANVPLPTPSTDSDMSPPDQPMPASPRTHAFVEHLQGQCHDSLLYEQWATTRDLSWMRLMKRSRCVTVMRSKLRRMKARM